MAGCGGAGGKSGAGTTQLSYRSGEGVHEGCGNRRQTEKMIIVKKFVNSENFGNKKIPHSWVIAGVLVRRDARAGRLQASWE